MNQKQKRSTIKKIDSLEISFRRELYSQTYPACIGIGLNLNLPIGKGIEKDDDKNLFNEELNRDNEICSWKNMIKRLRMTNY